MAFPSSTRRSSRPSLWLCCGLAGLACQGDTDGEHGATPHLDMVPIPAGTFLMGSPADEPGRYPDEAQHEVTLTHDYLISRFEITKEDWGTTGWDEGEPMVGVSWHSAARFAAELSTQEGLEACYVCNATPQCEPTGDPYQCEGYRLPTEAEWERAARGGREGFPYPSGGYLSRLPDSCDGPVVLSDGSLLEWQAHYCEFRHHDFEHELGAGVPNAYGLHAMSGEVWEWAHDRYRGYGGAVTDPYGTSGAFVMRGGSYWDGPRDQRVATRYRASPDIEAETVGFRLVRIQ